jgi:hypothetical protein
MRQLSYGSRHGMQDGDLLHDGQFFTDVTILSHGKNHLEFLSRNHQELCGSFRSYRCNSKAVIDKCQLAKGFCNIL